MPLKDAKSGKTLQSTIEQVIKSDYNWIKRSKSFQFDWEAEKENEVYKIFLLDQDDQILGLLSLIDYPDEYRIHLNLIEVSQSNIGKIKKIDQVAGCLIAFACKVAFDRSYFGFVSLQPKTRLINLYQEKYGFSQYGRLLAVEQKAASDLITKYLRDEEE